MKELSKVLRLFVVALFVMWSGPESKTAHAAIVQNPAANAAASDSTLQSKSTDAEGLKTISPEDLLIFFKGPKSGQPLILNVGPKLLYDQAHIPGAEYVGAGASPKGIAALRTRVRALPHGSFIVLYCGCCPWSRCPNIRPASQELSTLGFTNVKLLRIADNFGANWVDRGYPTVKGN